jgi:hypothetical protein
MPRDFLHNHPEFADLIRIVAQEKSIDPALVEKDYWIMHCLYGLQQLGFSFQLKGGTSLSKGHQIISRFSEDIDILIEPPAARDVKVGKNQNSRARAAVMTLSDAPTRKIDLQDANLQCVAGLRAVNEDRPGKDVSRRAAILDLAVNGTLVFRHNARRHGTGLVDLYRVERGRGLDRDDVAGIDRQHGFERRAEMTDVYGLRTRHQGVFRAECIAR